jgi:hypothetical protein
MSVMPQHVLLDIMFFFMPTPHVNIITDMLNIGDDAHYESCKPSREVFGAQQLLTNKGYSPEYLSFKQFYLGRLCDSQDPQ